MKAVRSRNIEAGDPQVTHQSQGDAALAPGRKDDQVRRLRKASLLGLIGSSLLSFLVIGCGGGGSKAPHSSTGPVSTLSRIPIYHGGPLLQHVRVVTLFWGPELEQNRLHRYFNGFFHVLFANVQ